MNKLVAFGCSYTQGHGLDHKDLAWPAVLANLMQRGCNNQAQNGSSNLKILTKILEHEFNSQDLVVVMWTVPERDMLIMQDGYSRNIGAWVKDSVVKHWIKTHGPSDLNFRSWLYIHHAWTHLSSKNLNFAFFTNESPYESFFSQQPSWCSHIEFDQNKLVEYVQEHGVAADGVHPSAKCHEKFATKVFGELAERSKAPPC
jgi:lysophospholipase L1-like esterase